jgi:DNA-binding transcriptional ArsR family regulator
MPQPFLPGGANPAPPGALFSHILFEETLHRLDELFVATGVRAEVERAYRLLCREATCQGEMTEDGVLLRVTEEQLSRELRVSDRSARKYLGDLAGLGLLELLPEGRGKAVRLFEPQVALERLASSPEVAAVLRQMYPERYEAPLVRAYTVFREAPDEYLETWVDRRMDDTRRRLLGQAIGDAQQMSAEAAERRRARAVKNAQGRKPKKTTRTTDRANDLCEYLRFRIKSSLGSIFQPVTTQKDLSLMKRLRDSQGVDAVRQAIDYVTIPVNWNRLRQRCRLTSEVPTVGVLWGFKETIFPLAMDATTPKRSGGAVSGADAAEGDLDSFNGDFS